MLNLPQWGVVLRVRGPSIQERVGRDILVDADLICQCVVLVVLIAPPSDSQASAKSSELSEFVRELVDTVDVVVPKPARLSEKKTHEKRRKVVGAGEVAICKCYSRDQQ